MELSIIIPTYNEEEYLPKLLKSIKSQKFTNYEIIVSDANSADRTREIAKEHGCRIVTGGTPGIGRNKGAEIAKGEYLLFLDSDLELTENYLEKVLNEIKREEGSIGITLMNPLSEKIRDKFLHNIANWFMIAFEKIKPHGAGCYGIIVKKAAHNKYNGFDESLNYGEDTDYIERIAEQEKFKVLRDAKILVSTRRLEEEGLIKLAKQYGRSTFNDFRGRRTDAEELEYSFGHNTKDLIEENTLIKRIESQNSKKDKKIKLLKNEKSIGSEITPYKRKKIFYSVCGEGMGHAVRSAVIIKELLKKYEIFVFASDRGYEYLNDKFDNVFEITGFNTVYENNKVRNKKTLINAIKDTPNNLKENYGTLYKKAKEIGPNILISDFENYINILSTIINVPLISIDNIQMITKTKVEYPPESKIEMIKAKGIIKYYIHFAKRYILTSFFYPEVKNPEKSIIYPPVIRDKVRELKTSYGDYILVYQTSTSNNKLINTLKKIDEKFIIYGFDEEKTDGNLTFRKFNEDEIYNDMKDAKAVLTNGGFTFISEAIALKKPIFSVPAKGNFEQLINGFYVEKLGYGMFNRQLHNKEFLTFLDNLDKYKETLKTVKVENNSRIIKEIEDSIEKYAID
ncbi:MJ1255/VC2487 family glycosyltransferase [Methanobrevibacter filiformis]|uniref:Putative glycosyltransferase EpsH n=1 Tax=Methanobrevibacter filiformis TaxID=55758 RepID=A0A166F838_9EURY|nr:MJ1255/VC2487 family glycosyltransferase [Methanobrevibacter filiformis]KZX17416.1 putative glycosyltransferase EpsH [Methanobrevibacter filiformis]